MAIVRVEQFFPSPRSSCGSVLRRYRKAREWVWVQEESQNNGGWWFMEPRLRAAGLPGGVRRPRRQRQPGHRLAARSTSAEQKELVEAAIERPRAALRPRHGADPAAATAVAEGRSPGAASAGRIRCRHASGVRMAVDIKVPSVGESITEGIVAALAEGQRRLPSRRTSRCSSWRPTRPRQEVVAPADGVLRIASPKVKKSTHRRRRRPRRSPSAQPTPGCQAARRRRHRTPECRRSRPRRAAPLRRRSPAGRRRRHGPCGLTGTGRGGRIIKEDVLAVIGTRQTRDGRTAPAAAQTLVPLPSAGDGACRPRSPRCTVEPPSPARPKRAQRHDAHPPAHRRALLAAQQNAAILTTFNEADMSAVMALRPRYKEAFQKKHGVGLGFMTLLRQGGRRGAARRSPPSTRRIDGTDIVYHHYYDIGVAVSTEKGLMVPVLRDADRLSFADIEKAIADLAAKARDGKISVADLQGGTFTITNGGIFGSLLSTPILNPPQSGILGMHAIQKRPVAVDDQVVIRPMMYLAFSYDHRLIDGREAVSFLVRVKECIETPERLLLEI